MRHSCQSMGEPATLTSYANRFGDRADQRSRSRRDPGRDGPTASQPTPAGRCARPRSGMGLMAAARQDRAEAFGGRGHRPGPWRAGRALAVGRVSVRAAQASEGVVMSSAPVAVSSRSATAHLAVTGQVPAAVLLSSPPTPRGEAGLPGMAAGLDPAAAAWGSAAAGHVPAAPSTLTMAAGLAAAAHGGVRAAAAGDGPPRSAGLNPACVTGHCGDEGRGRPGTGVPGPRRPPVTEQFALYAWARSAGGRRPGGLLSPAARAWLADLVAWLEAGC